MHEVASLESRARHELKWELGTGKDPVWTDPDSVKLLSRMADTPKTRRDGMRVLAVDGIQLCHFFMRTGSCPHDAKGLACDHLHLAKEARPPCPNFSKSGVCKFAGDCWYPHVRPPISSRQPNLGVQVKYLFSNCLAATCCGQYEWRHTPRQRLQHMEAQGDPVWHDTNGGRV